MTANMILPLNTW